MAFWSFSSIFLYSQYYFHPVGPHCPKIFTVLGLCPLVTFARQNVDWSETQYPKHTTKARRYIHIFKTYWRTSSCTAHEFVRRALLTQNGARSRAPSNSGWFRIDVNGHKSLSFTLVVRRPELKYVAPKSFCKLLVWGTFRLVTQSFSKTFFEKQQPLIFCQFF